MCLAIIAYVYVACTVHVCVTIFSTGGEIQPVSNFTELLVLTLATRSCVSCYYFDYITAFETLYDRTLVEGGACTCCEAA